ncbi:MAG: ABC transporter permease [Opitutales bacterium]|jgi:lipopolysaccharide transport system permease protein
MKADPSNNPSRFSRNKELLKQLTVRNISESIRGSVLGVLWLIFNPLLNMLLYVTVFGILFGGKFGNIENENSINYAIGVYIGLTMVNLINDTLSRSTHNLSVHSNLIRKVVFPVQLLPISQVLGSSFKYLVNAVLWLAVGLFYGSVLRWEILYLPLIILPMVVMSMGLAFLIGAVSVYFRDTQQLTSVLTQLVFWSSGVFFSAHKVMQAPEVWSVLKWNPVLLAIENIRALALWGHAPSWNQVAFLYAAGLFSLGIGLFVFSRLRSGFADFL